MNRGPWLDDHPDGEALPKKLRVGNPSSGCIYINGAVVGQVLTVHIDEIETEPFGFTRFRGQNGAMPGWLGGSGIGYHERVVQIVDNHIIWKDELKIPISPMLGVVGLAPAHTRWSNVWAGEWGGNFDIQEIKAAAAVHILINVPGALLHVGDMHARQGDGEICGAGGIETGGKARLRCELSERPQSMTRPRITDETHIMATGIAKPAEDAFRIALSEMILWLEEDYGFARGEAYLFLGQVLEARCTQFVNPTFSYVAKVNRKYLPQRI